MTEIVPPVMYGACQPWSDRHLSTYHLPHDESGDRICQLAYHQHCGSLAGKRGTTNTESGVQFGGSLSIREVRYHAYTCVHVCISSSVQTFLQTYVQTYMPTYLNTYIHTDRHEVIRSYIHIQVHVYLQNYIHTNVHTHVYGRDYDCPSLNPSHIHVYVHAIMIGW